MDPLRYITEVMGNCKVFSTATQEENEAEWLAARSRGIGGSDVGAICGVSSYSSPRLVYLKKTGQYNESESFSDASLERMHFGHMLEPVVANEYSRRSGRKIAVAKATMVHKDFSWALANIDRFILDEEDKPVGILECKTAGEFMNEDWDSGELPMSYIYQLNWYLWVLNLTFGAFACLVGGNKFYYYEVFRNDDLLNEEIIPKVTKFWTYNVANMVEPDLIGSDADSEFVKSQNTAVVKNSEMVLAEDTYNELAQTIVESKAKVKELEAIIAEAENRIKDVLKTTEIGHTKDHVIKWSPRCQNRVDGDKLKANFPDVYKACLKQIEYRVFTVK